MTASKMLDSALNTYIELIKWFLNWGEDISDGSDRINENNYLKYSRCFLILAIFIKYVL